MSHRTRGGRRKDRQLNRPRVSVQPNVVIVRPPVAELEMTLICEAVFVVIQYCPTAAEILFVPRLAPGCAPNGDHRTILTAVETPPYPAVSSASTDTPG